jgi:hypothetical protein
MTRQERLWVSSQSNCQQGRPPCWTKLTSLLSSSAVIGENGPDSSVIAVVDDLIQISQNFSLINGMHHGTLPDAFSSLART